MNGTSCVLFFGAEKGFALPGGRFGAVGLFAVGGGGQALVHQQRSGGQTLSSAASEIPIILAPSASFGREACVEEVVSSGMGWWHVECGPMPGAFWLQTVVVAACWMQLEAAACW